jgi:arabinan endo-1,5-alpha-L-arabinosidase
MVLGLLLACLGSRIQGDALPVSNWSAFPGDSVTYENGGNVHDPCVFHFGSKYFCVSTSGDGFGVMRESPNLEKWTVLGPVLEQFPTWLTERYRHRSLWAPNVQRIGDELRMYYCMSNWGTNDSVIGFLDCKKFDPNDPLKGWVDQGLVLESKVGRDVFNAIDPEIAVDGAGNPWMFFGSYFAGLFTVALDKTTGKLADPDPSNLKLVARNTGEKGNPLEASAICHRGDYYYLFTSYGLAGQGVRSTYRIMVGRSTHIDGPFLDEAGVDMAKGGHLNVLKSSPPMFSPGHCHVFQDTDGRWLMPYHFYDGRRYWGNGLWGLPELQIRELLWSPDGWPMPGMPLPSNRPATAETGENIVGKWIFQSDFSAVQSLTLKKNYTFTLGPRTVGTWKRDKETLSLRTGEAAPELFFLAYGDRYFVGRNDRNEVVRAVREK